MLHERGLLTATIPHRREPVGLERIRAVVVDDADGIAAELDAAMEQSIAAVGDPWREATAPKTPNQFTSLVSVDG